MSFCFPLLILALPSALLTSLSPATTSDYEAYLARVKPAIFESARDRQPASWMAPFAGDLEKMRKGEVPVHSMSGKYGQEVRDGIIHDWVGGMFIPGANVQQVFAVIQDFDRQKVWYPEVLDAKLLGKEGDAVRSRLILLRKSWIEVVFDAELQSRYMELAPGQWLVDSSTTSVREIDDYGTGKAKTFAPGQGYGLMWRFNSYWNLQQRPEGVYASLRVISLSRQVPTGLGWIVHPFVRSVPMQSLESTLLNTRKAVKSL
jgi:hypothetical protein